MSSLNPSIGRKRPGPQKLQLKASVAKAAAKKRAPSVLEFGMRQRSNQRIAFATIGGFKVFGSPVQPTHRTTLQIAEAVAELD